jgi:hypothetical protein
MTATPTNTFPLGNGRYKFITVSLLKPTHGGHRSKTAAFNQKWFKMPVGNSKKL